MVNKYIYLSKDNEFKEIRGECTLCLVNDTYLYAFCWVLLHQEYNSSIEKCNLRKENRTWEYVEYNEINGIKFNPSFFGVSYFKNEQILLLGDNPNSEPEQNNQNYVIKIGMENGPDDQIYEFSSGENRVSGVFREKLFIPIENDKAINIPLVIGEEIQAFIIERNTGNIQVKKQEKSINIE